MATGKRSSYRLSEDIQPEKYSLFFDLNLKEFRYICREEIALTISKPISQIIVHSKDLKIKEVNLQQGNKELPSVFSLDPKTDKLVVKLANKKTVKGKVKLIIRFDGKIREDLVGLYRSKYKDKKGKEQFWASTQFEPAYARMCIPCFDEPEFKSVYSITMKTDREFDSISNLPAKKTIIEGSKQITEFYDSPKMSVYLLYLGVGKYEYLEGKFGKTIIRVISVPGKKEQGKFALDLCKKFLTYFTEYSGIPYPLPKLDLIAVPDFASGAMENWGAITFRELILLSDPKVTSSIIQRRIAEVIAHELWHQWSGNLVTMKWWDDLWLNESFATYMAYKAVAHYFPEWHMWEDFTRTEMGSAFGYDSLKTTHPIHVEVRDPNEIGQIFDAISYDKGGSVLRMLDVYLGEEKFRKGVSRYLKRYAYSGATAEDLWNSLSEISDKPIKRIMEGWVKLAGHPIVESRLNGSQILLKQKRFVFGDHKERDIWPIPLVIRSSNSNETIDVLLDKSEKSISLNNVPEWYKINFGQAGFYRVKYSEENLSKLENLVFGKKFGTLDRWGIQDEVYELSVNGELTVDRYLDLVKSYYNEEDFFILSGIHSNLSRIKYVFINENIWQQISLKLKKHFNEPYRKKLMELGWNPKKNESQLDAFTRELAIAHLAFIEDKKTIAEAFKKYQKYIKNTASVPPNIKRSILHIVASNGDQKDYNQMLKLYFKIDIVEDKRILLNMLTQFKDPKLLKKTLDMSLTDKVRIQELPIVIGGGAGNPYARQVVLPWFKQNWKKLEKYKEDASIFRNVLQSVIGSCTNDNAASELKRFLDSHNVGYLMVINQSFEILKRRLSWKEKNREVLKKYFS